MENIESHEDEKSSRIDGLVEIFDGEVDAVCAVDGWWMEVRFRVKLPASLFLGVLTA